VEGGYDFLLTFHHPSVPVLLDPAQFPHRLIGADSLLAVRSAALPGAKASVPLLSYAQNSFLGRVAIFAQAEAGGPPTPIAHTNENAMAEALKCMALEGHGLAWLPRSLIARELAEGRLVTEGAETALEVRLYRNAAHRRAVVSSVWQAAEIVAAEIMQDRNTVV
jgi:DNA-binding transcriptional LysR family regulator